MGLIFYGVMKMLYWIALGLSSLLGAVEPASEPVQATSLLVENCEFGDIYATTPAVCDLTFSNSGNLPIRVYNFRVVSGSGTMDPPELTIAPRGTAHVRAHIDTSKSAGRNSYIVLFDSDPESNRRSAKVNGFVLSTLDQSKPQIDLGVVDLLGDRKTHEYSFSSHEVADFRLTKILDNPEWLSVAISPDHRTLKVSPKSGVLGLQEEYIRVGLNTPRQKEVYVKVKADLHGDVVPSANPIDLGVLRTGNKNEALVRLDNRRSKAFEVGQLRVEGFSGTAEVLPCQPVSVACKMLRLVVSDEQPIGSVRGTLHVGLPDSGQVLPITVWGLLVAKDYNIRKIGDEASAQSSVASPTPDMASVLKAATKPKPAQVTPPGEGPLLRWAVANASTVYGFQIFRSDAEAGPYLLINPTPIHADTGSNESQSFQWRDTQAKRGATYYYSIGIIRVSGAKEPLVGPQKVVVK